MKKHNLWDILLNRFFILFNLTKNHERPSNDEESSLHTVKAIVLPEKETVMLDEFSGFTKTKIQIREVYKGNLKIDDVIKVSEPYYEGYYGGKKCLIVHESYEPLVVGKTYTFLLTKVEEDALTSKVAEYQNLDYFKELYHKAS